MTTGEIRTIQTHQPTASDGTIRGYAAVFNSPSQVITERGRIFREVIQPGAFARSLATPPLGDIVALWNHGMDGRPPLGRTSAGTLRLWEDPVGLAYELQLPASARDIQEAISRRDVRGNSIRFRNPVDRWYHESNVLHRSISALELVEVSLVIHPAYPAAGISDRSAAEAPELHPLNLAQVRIQLAEADR